MMIEIGMQGGKTTALVQDKPLLAELGKISFGPPAPHPAVWLSK